MRNVISAAAVAILATTLPLAAWAAEPGSVPPPSAAENVTAAATSAAPHYQWQYHYDRKAQYEGHWVLVQ